MERKLFPLNLTAQAAKRVAGNSVITRLESGVGNCYPGLEFDHRNLDRRFFPGFLFDYISQDDAAQPKASLRGARLVAVVTTDPGLQPTSDISSATPELAAQLSRDLNAFPGDSGGPISRDLEQGGWYISELEQEKVVISCEPSPGQGQPPTFLDGMIVWRLVRSLEPGAVTVRLRFRKPDGTQSKLVAFDGWRRPFVQQDSGVIDPVYDPGELTQSLCSPWQHDFRDCACTYWASNHPDIVLTESLPGEPTLPSGGSANPERATTSVDWLRSDRRREASAAAQGMRRLDRRFQMDSYEINTRWDELAIVLGRKETSDFYASDFEPHAAPFPSPADLAAHLRYLATLEHAVALEYLYALYSLHHPDKVPSEIANKFSSLREDLTFARHELLAIAVSEMRHLRWANEMLWKLWHEELIPDFSPELGLADKIPVDPPADRPRALRPLTPAVLRDFIAVEQPSGGIDGQYARVLSTLRRPHYGEQLGLYPMAARVIAEGMQHYSRFREVSLVLRGYGDENPPYLRTSHIGTDQEAAEALKLYDAIKDLLRRGYETGDPEEVRFVAEARSLMFKLDAVAENLAERGIGVPFFR
jgi:hypothetical protein